MERPGDKNKRRPAAEINVRRGRARRLGDGAPLPLRHATNFHWRRILVYVRSLTILFERRQLTKFTRAESCRVLDMDFLDDGMFVA